MTREYFGEDICPDQNHNPDNWQKLVHPVPLPGKFYGTQHFLKALFFSEKDKVAGTPYEDDWKAIDINWENIVSASITKIITVNLYTQLLYDKEVSKKGRFKETLGIGFVFKMM